MYYKLSYGFVIVIFSLLAAGCTSALKKPTFDDAQKSGVSVGNLIRGRDLYIGNCGSCHALYLPERFTGKEWKSSMDSMQNRVRLTDEQSELILKYLYSKSKN